MFKPEISEAQGRECPILVGRRLTWAGEEGNLWAGEEDNLWAGDYTGESGYVCLHTLVSFAFFFMASSIVTVLQM